MSKDMPRRKRRRPRSGHVCLIEQAEALGEPPEDPLLLFSVFFGVFGSQSTWRSMVTLLRELAAQFLGLAEKQGATVPLMIGHRLMGISLLLIGRIANRQSALRSGDCALRSRSNIVNWRPDLARIKTCQSSPIGLGLMAPWLSRGRALRRRGSPQGCARDRPSCHADVCVTFYRAPFDPLWQLLARKRALA